MTLLAVMQKVLGDVTVNKYSHIIYNNKNGIELHCDYTLQQYGLKEGDRLTIKAKKRRILNVDDNNSHIENSSIDTQPKIENTGVPLFHDDNPRTKIQKHGFGLWLLAFK